MQLLSHTYLVYLMHFCFFHTANTKNPKSVPFSNSQRHPPPPTRLNLNLVTIHPYDRETDTCTCHHFRQKQKNQCIFLNPTFNTPLRCATQEKEGKSFRMKKGQGGQTFFYQNRWGKKMPIKKAFSKKKCCKITQQLQIKYMESFYFHSFLPLNNPHNQEPKGEEKNFPSK